MNFTNKAELEQYFAENFDTVFFPILADIYKKEGDFSRARKVCEIGLEYHPNSVPGYFVLAEVYKLESKLNEAEKFYKNILAIDPWHYRATVNLVKIETELERSPESISKLWRKVLRINPTHTEARTFLNQKNTDEPEPLEDKKSNNNQSDDLHKSVKREKADDGEENKAEEPSSSQFDKEVDDLKKKLEIPPQDTIVKDEKAESPSTPDEFLAPTPPSIKLQKISEDELQALDITPRMATFTLVNVLKKQKLYQQSLYVLKMLEEKGADKALVDQERQAIKALIAENESK